MTINFDCYIGIDYSGAAYPGSRLKALQVYAAAQDRLPWKVVAPDSSHGDRKNWSREAIARWLVDLVTSGKRIIAGIDHCFSLPLSYFQRYALQSWEAFLDDFVRHWPVHCPKTSVDSLLQDPPDRMGEPGELRLTERWTQGARSVFIFRGPGTVGKSSFAGIPWLHCIRRQTWPLLHFWPFDGWDFQEDRSVLVEAYPAICKRRYPRQDRTQDEHDAYAIAAWLREMDAREALDRYCHPPLTDQEKSAAGLEGWILGVD